MYFSEVTNQKIRKYIWRFYTTWRIT